MLRFSIVVPMVCDKSDPMIVAMSGWIVPGRNDARKFPDETSTLSEILISSAMFIVL